jgi:putative ABC transport system permease protein
LGAVTIDPGWPVAAALVALLAVAVLAHRVNGYALERPVLLAAGRAVVQLGIAALLISAVVDHLALSAALVVAMFAMGVLTTTRRVGAPAAWPYAALAMAAGVVPVVAVVLATGAVPLQGIALIPVAGILVGNAMTAHTLLGRRAFSALEDDHAQYEAGLSLGLLPAEAVSEVIHRHAPEALLPGLDQVRTTGVVTLPGAFIGVMLGGGSPVQAATAQVLVLFGIMATQTVTVGVAERLVAARRMLPQTLRAALQD